MTELNRRAMSIPREDLLKSLEEAIYKKSLILEERDKKYGKDRVPVYSYGENLYLPETFGFDMRDYFRDPELALDIVLRSRIFWLDNSHDDGNYSLVIPAISSMYYDMTLFGINISHTWDGVPNMEPHPLSESDDLDLIGPFDFETTGEMPLVLKQFEECKRLAEEFYEGKVKMRFPFWSRGPLDTYIQLRGYENFVTDTYDNPDFVHALLNAIMERRFAFNERARMLRGETKENGYNGIADDWINFPFITEDIFHEFIVPAYKKIVEREGIVRNFHTCGVLEPIAKDLVELFPKMSKLELSGWNDVAKVHDIVPNHVKFQVNMINTFVLFGKKEDYIKKLESVKKVADRRPIELCAQAIVKAHPTFDESMGRMNDFIDLAHEVLH